MAATYRQTFEPAINIPSYAKLTNIYIAEDDSYYYFGFYATDTASSAHPEKLSYVNFPSPVKHYTVPYISASFPFSAGMFSNYQANLKTADGEIIACLTDSSGSDNILTFTVLSKKSLILQLQ